MTKTTTNNFILTLLALSLTTLVSCKSYDIKPGSERIRVFETEPKGCIFIGEIPREQEDTIVGVQSDEIEMNLATRVKLRNKAFELGGNVIIFMKNKKPAAGPVAADLTKKSPAATPVTPAAGSVPTETSEKTVTTVFLATVFRCPASIVNQ